MLACAANRIVAAPFAMVGSIGVVAQVPNVNRLLKRHDVDYEEFTAGEHKRSVTLLGEITSEGRAHFREKVVSIHAAFRNFVLEQRPHLDIEAVGNGDHWIGAEAKGLGLVDELMTSEAYLFQRRNEAQLIGVSSEEKTSLLAQLRRAIGLRAGAGLMRALGFMARTVR
jgi:serine protease SohB